MRRIFTLAFAFLFIISVHAQDQITNTAAISNTFSGVGTKPWAIPPAASLIWQNVRVPDDNLVAGVSLAGDEKSDFLVLSDFNFSIPLNYSIAQIIVDVYGNSSRNNTIVVPYLQLIKTTNSGYNPIPGSIAKSGFVRFDSPKSSTQTYGSSCSQLCYWNTTLGPADVNDPAFGLVIQFGNNAGSPQQSLASIDYITITLVLSQQSPLPVNFIGFTGNKTPIGTQLSWKVGDESDVKFYNVERSNNGIIFNSIGMVRATGDKEYSFTDVQPSENLTYYRIKNVDMDDRFKYSTILSFRNGKSELMFKAFPTLVHSSVTLQHDVSSAGSKITINSADGRLIKSLVPNSNAIQTSVDLSNQHSGLYIIRYDNGLGKVQTVKVVKD